MMAEASAILPAHTLVLLLLQLSLLLLSARVLAEVMRRVGQPSVLGELLAGILLGPTVFRHVAPGTAAFLFPADPLQVQLLEFVSWLGMILLLLLTGMETDIRAVRNLGRASLTVSVLGTAVPFAGGLALGWFLPDHYLVDPGSRPTFTVFLATAMAISALPVIAKILIDLDLIRRNVGIVALSAAVVGDVTGWLLLSVIAGVSSGGTLSIGFLARTVGGLVGFGVVLRWIAFPLLARAVRYVNASVHMPGTDLTIMLAFTFLCAAATEALGVHAVLGAFAAGIVIRQVPRVRTTSLHTMESFVLATLSPIFFAYVGLKVDLWEITSWRLPLLVIGVAVVGKLIGGYLGGRLGRMSPWESLALGFALNARGAMELVVALVGLQLGLLSAEMYGTIVAMAVATSFMAPLMLRWVAPRLPMHDEERRRLEDDRRRPLIPTTPPAILVPTAGGENALAAISLAAPLVQRRHGRLTALYVANESVARRRWAIRGAPPAGTRIDEHLARAEELVGADNFSVRRAVSDDVPDAVVREAGRDYDLVFLGAAPHRPLDSPLARRIVRDAPVPIVVVQLRGDPDFERVLVPFDGSEFAHHAAELAFACARLNAAPVDVLHVIDEEGGRTPGTLDPAGSGHGGVAAMETRLRTLLTPLAEAHGAAISVRVVGPARPGEVIITESRSGRYGLLVLGTESRLLGRPSLFGRGTAEIIERSGCTTAIILPGPV